MHFQSTVEFAVLKYTQVCICTWLCGLYIAFCPHLKLDRLRVFKFAMVSLLSWVSIVSQKNSSVARKNEETKMKENQTPYLKRKQGYEIKKLRINVRVKAISLSSNFLLCMCYGYLITEKWHFISFVLWILCLAQGMFWVVEDKRERLLHLQL